MPQPLPWFYIRGSSAPADHVFRLLSERWTARYRASGAQVDIPIDGPPAAWICISSEFPAMPHPERRELVCEVMEIIIDHASLLYCDAEGHA